jgi:hypothetical protein
MTIHCDRKMSLTKLCRLNVVLTVGSFLFYNLHVVWNRRGVSSQGLTGINAFYVLVVNRILFPLWIRCHQCGCYQSLSTAVVRRLRSWIANSHSSRSMGRGSAFLQGLSTVRIYEPRRTKKIRRNVTVRALPSKQIPLRQAANAFSLSHFRLRPSELRQEFWFVCS